MHSFGWTTISFSSESATTHIKGVPKTTRRLLPFSLLVPGPVRIQYGFFFWVVFLLYVENPFAVLRIRSLSKNFAVGLVYLNVDLDTI